MALVVVTGPELAALLVFDVPADTSSGFVAATPENSCNVSAIVAADPVCTVTVVTEAAFGEYHISPSELCPETLKVPILVHAFPAESVTEVTWFVAPV